MYVSLIFLIYWMVYFLSKPLTLVKWATLKQTIYSQHKIWPLDQWICIFLKQKNKVLRPIDFILLLININFELELGPKSDLIRVHSVHVIVYNFN